MDYFDATTVDDSSRTTLITKYNEVNQRYQYELEEVRKVQMRNANLTDELMQLEELVFKQKSETKNKAVTPKQDTLFGFMGQTEINKPLRVEMHYFKKLAELTNAITDRLTFDYKLNPENRLEPLISETETLRKTLVELNEVNEKNSKIYEDLKNEEIYLCAKFDKEVVDYNRIIELNNYDLNRYKEELQRVEVESQSKQDVLDALINHLNDMNVQAKSMEEQIELWKESSIDGHEEINN